MRHSTQGRYCGLGHQVSVRCGGTRSDDTNDRLGGICKVSTIVKEKGQLMIGSKEVLVVGRGCTKNLDGVFLVIALDLLRWDEGTVLP